MQRLIHTLLCGWLLVLLAQGMPPVVQESYPDKETCQVQAVLKPTDPAVGVRWECVPSDEYNVIAYRKGRK